MIKIFKKYSNLSIPAKASLWFIVCSCIQSGIKFISLPIFANIMNINDYGNVTIYTSWMSIIFIFATLSLGKSNGIFYVAMVRYKNNKDDFTSSMEGLTIFLCFVSFMLMIFSTIFFGDWMQIGINQYFAMFFDLVGYGIVLLWLLRMRYDYKYKELLTMTAIYSVATVLIPVITILICPSNIPQAIVKNWSGAITSFLIGIIALFLSFKKSSKILDKNYWISAIKFNVILIPHYLSNVILVQSDRIMISRIINEAAAAIYNVAYTLGVAAQVITQALINAINPWMYQKMSKKEGKKCQNIITQLVLLVAIMIIGICLIMPETFNFLFPKTYNEALKVIPPVAAGVIWAFIFNIYASIELYFSGNKYVSFSSFVGASINIIANLIFIPKYGIIAAAYTTLVCDIIYAFLHTVFSKKLLKKHMNNEVIAPYRKIWSIGIFTTIMCLIISLLYDTILIRYSLIIIIIMFCIMYRNKIKKLINFRKEN